MQHNPASPAARGSLARAWSRRASGRLTRSPRARAPAQATTRIRRKSGTSSRTKLLPAGTRSPPRGSPATPAETRPPRRPSTRLEGGCGTLAGGGSNSVAGISHFGVWTASSGADSSEAKVWPGRRLCAQGASLQELQYNKSSCVNY